jgi:hypothetical protein
MLQQRNGYFSIRISHLGEGEDKIHFDQKWFLLAFLNFLIFHNFWELKNCDVMSDISVLQIFFYLFIHKILSSEIGLIEN